jgi:hypothetical protein
MASRLAEIYRSEKSTGGGLGSAVGKRLKEKIDPRQALDQSGLLVSMFPSLKTYKATKNKVSSPKISSDIVGSGIDNDILNSISATSSLTAKNSMSLPMMARDMNLMKLNIFKLVKLQGGSANINKTDIFWKNAQARESSYENTMSKIAGGGMIGKMAKSSSVGRQKRDGQSPDSALFVTGGAGGGVQASEVAEGILTAGVLKKVMTSTVGFMASPIGLSILGVAAGGVAIAGLARKLQDDQIDKAAERGDVKEVKQQLKNQALGGESELYLSPEDSVGIDKALNEIAEDRVNKLKKPTKLEIEAQAASERLKNLPDTGAGGGRGFINPNMPTGAGGGRGFVNPTLVTPEAETVPSNVVRSSSGEAIRTGSGGYVTSGETPSPVSSTAPTGPRPPSPTPMGSELGKLSAKFESAKDGPGAIGYDSTGGTSYGTYQIASKTGTMNRFLAFLDKNNPNLANQLRSAGDPNTGSKKGPFPDVWKKIASEDPKGFDKLQHDFIQKTHYDPAARGLMKLGFNINEQSDAMKDVLWSTSVQHGSDGAVKIFSKAIKELGVSASPEKLISRIYQERGTKFASSTEAVQKSVLNRFSEESKMALASFKSGPSVSPSVPSTGTAVASASTSVSDGKMAAMMPTGGNTVINNKPVSVASGPSSSGGKSGSTYDNELFQTLVGYQSGTA